MLEVASCDVIPVGGCLPYTQTSTVVPLCRLRELGTHEGFEEISGHPSQGEGRFRHLDQRGAQDSFVDLSVLAARCA